MAPDRETEVQNVIVSACTNVGPDMGKGQGFIQAQKVPVMQNRRGSDECTLKSRC